MMFLNPWLLVGLAGVAIPVIIHLVRRQAARPLDWGAMRFLMDTVSVRRRRIEWEDLLLMAARCLLLGLVALALARPFVPPDSAVPWMFVLPAVLIGIACFGASFVLSSGRVRWIMRGIAGFLLVGSAGLVVWEKSLNLKRFEVSGRRDVALVIDGSASMECVRDGVTIFSRAVEEARQLVKAAPRGTAFTVILGGSAPEVMTATPLTHREDVLGVLDLLQPVGGGFRAHDALGMATLGLAEGGNAVKEMVVFTDSQRSGWRFENPGAWDGLERAWEALPTRPKVILRDFGVPQNFRNVAVTELEISRGVVGTDRAVVFRVTVENTGVEPVTPGPVTLEVEGQRVGESPVGLLVAGQRETVEISHRFTRVGPQVVEARIVGQDDLAADDRRERVVMVRDRLRVVLVDGNPAGSFFERAAGYAALALAPSGALLSGKAGEEFLMDPQVVAVTTLREEDLAGAAVVVLADVSRLPVRLADRVAAMVSAGAGLVVVAGPRAEESFYNGWQGSEGPLLPMELAGEGVDAEGVAPAVATFGHEALAKFVKDGDLAEARVTRWRKTGAARAGGVLGAALMNGDPWIAARSYGGGRCLLVTSALDARSGSLPARRAFVPLVHELVTWAAGGGIDLNVGSAWSPSVVLNAAASGHDFSDEPMAVLDPRGLPREARVEGGGLELAIGGPAVPGVYRVDGGRRLDGLFPGLDGGSLPVVVGREAGESRFEVMTAEDLEMIRKHVDLVLPGSVADVLGVLEGKGFGREIWKWLALAAFGFFLLESVLARWVSRSRRVADEVRVEFGNAKGWRAGI